MMSLFSKDISIKITSCTDKVITLKLKNDCVLGYLNSLINDELSIPEKHQRLVYMSKTLRGEGETLASLGIGDGSEIALLHPERDEAGQLSIVFWETGKTLHLQEGEWHINWSTDKLREEAYKLHNIDRNKSDYIMVHNAITIPDDYAIVEFDVSAGSTVFILPKKKIEAK
eukprot:TRINITY_DN4957_c1_g1_i1.p1 TRINITY_DN4957_c1_g1~~TRINITY_DN4957_c1_g1_i1.p1  ORF type:complete len:171 (+),score=30.50 TRINITY_DN4957_c1_g1_i1:44-556(+)